MKNTFIEKINKSKLIPLILVILLSFFFISIYYTDIVFNANKYLINDRGDAAKNYFTYASQIDQDSYVNTDIMNYPYGENFLYLDCQPAFTMLFHLLSNIFPSISEYSIGIINFLMIFSIVLTSLFIYLILCELKVNRIYAAICGFAIAVLSPQIIRIVGHLALSYSFVIPVLWYLFIKFCKSENRKLQWSILLGVFALLFYFLHGYLGMMAVLLVLFCYIFYYFFDLKKQKPFNKRQFLYFAFQIVIPTLMYYLFTVITDNHLGRTNNPWGFFTFRTSLQSVFLPIMEPLKPLLEKIFKIGDQVWEGWAYIGIGSVITLVYFLIKYIFNRSYIKSFWKSNLLMKISFFAGICILLVAMAYPFRLGLQFLLDWFPFIKNFRSIGRFAWGFYFVATVFSVVFLSYAYNNTKYKKLVFIALLLLPVSYYAEGVSYHRRMQKSFEKAENAFKRGAPTEMIKNALASIDPKEYQAIIPLPFYQSASENYDKYGTDKVYFTSMTLAYHSYIPLMSSYSTRLSIIENKNKLELLSPFFYPKNVEKDIKDNRDFLILYTHEELMQSEKEILNKSNEIYTSDDFSLYRISREQLFKKTSEEEFEIFLNIKDHLIVQNDFLCNDSNAVAYYNSFDTISSEICYRGAGALKIDKDGYHILCELDMNAFEEGEEYIVSIWMYNLWKNFGQDYLRSNLYVEEIDKEGNAYMIANTDPIHSYTFNDLWTLIELKFNPSPDKSKIKVGIHGGSKPRKAVYYIDDLLIYKNNTLVYRFIEENQIYELFKNNHRIILTEKN